VSLIDETGEFVVSQVAPRSTSQIEEQAYGLLREVAPLVLEGAALDVAELVDHQLQNIGIHFSPIHDVLLPNAWALAQHDGEPFDDIEVLVRSSEWHRLFAGGRNAHHARGTFMHELGHAILHVNQIRRRLSIGGGLPRQLPEHQLKAYVNAEWQAWCFAGCMLAPRSAILAHDIRTPEALALAFNTSTQLMQLHLKRLGLLNTHIAPGARKSSTWGGR
jgi:hypothetical protein